VDELGTGAPRKSAEALEITSEYRAPTAGELGRTVMVSVWTPLPTTTLMSATESPPSDRATAWPTPDTSSAPDATAPAASALRTTANLEHDPCDIAVALPTLTCGG
jgi:hypothetical protein